MTIITLFICHNIMNFTLMHDNYKSIEAHAASLNRRELLANFSSEHVFGKREYILQSWT